MTTAEVRGAYGVRSAAYIELFGSIDSASTEDREAVLTWASACAGPIIDVGCGPGQWTNFLSRHGFELEGIDPTPEFVAAAQRRFPDNRFRLGQAEHLGVDSETLGGILSWYSLIHTEPELIGAALTEFGRCLRPGGRLALGFFEGPELAPFDHAVTTAYFWPIDILSARIEAHGFTVVSAETRTDPGVRRHGLIIAERAHVSP